MSYLQVKKEIERGNINRLYFMYGTQSFLMEDIIQSIVKHTVGSLDDANIITYSLQDTLLDIAVEEAETFPFFGGEKVVIIKDFFLVTSQKQEGKLEHDLSRLEQYIEQPSPEAVLIILSSLRETR